MGESCQSQLERARQKQSVKDELKEVPEEDVQAERGRIKNQDSGLGTRGSRIRIKNKGSGRLHWRGQRNNGRRGRRSGRRSGASSSCSRVGMSIRRNRG